MTDDIPERRTRLRGLLSRNQFVALVSGLGVLAIGMLTVIWTPGRVVVLKWILGSVFVFMGASDAAEALAIRKQASHWPALLLRAGLNVVFGVLILAWTGITEPTLAYLVGANLLCYGALAIVVSRAIPPDVEAHSRNLWRGILALGIGLVLVVLPDRSVFVIAMLAGFYLIIFGLLLLAASYQLQKLKDQGTGDESGGAAHA